MISAKSLRIKFDKIDGFIRIFDGNRYLSGITYVFSLYYSKVKVDSYNSLPKEKKLTLNNVIILLTLVLNKDQNHSILL